MTEIYSMMKYLQSAELERYGLKNFDSWAANFGDTVTSWELAPEGNKYRPKTRFAKFINMPELMSIFKQSADIKTADVLNLNVPTCEQYNICVQPTDTQMELVNSLSKRAEAVQNGLVDPSEDNMLTITNDGRKIGLDQRLINPNLSDEPNTKINACVNNVFDIWEKNMDKKSTQLIFCDLGVPQSKEDLNKNGMRFSAYNDIKEKLIEKGVPKDEIAFIHDTGDSEVKKAQMFAKVRSGEIRVLIGSTAKLGAGTNIQDKLIASHDLDCPWKPADMTQRAGRMIRQGNENENVQLFRYVTEKTFDAYLFQTLEKKQNFISQIMTSKSPARVCEDIDEQSLDYAEIKALCAGDPRIKERMELDNDVTRLNMLKSGYLSQKYELEDRVLKIIPKQIATTKNAIQGIQKDIKKLNQYKAPLTQEGEELFEMKIVGTLYTDKDKASIAFQEACTKAVMGNPNKSIVIGEYKGFPLAVCFDTFSKSYKANIKGSITHSTELGINPKGNLQRINNLLSNIPKRLNTLEMELFQLNNNLEKGKQEIGKPFEFENQLRKKEERLTLLTAELQNTNVSINEEITSNKTENKEKIDEVLKPTSRFSKEKVMSNQYSPRSTKGSKLPKEYIKSSYEKS